MRAAPYPGSHALQHFSTLQIDVKFSPDFFFFLDGGFKLGHKIYGFIKASMASEIKSECIANYLIGVVLFLFTAAY